MDQKIEFNSNGLNILQIDRKVDTLQNLQLKEIKYHPETSQIRVIFEDQYKYYYLLSDSLFIENTGIIKNIFVAINLDGQVSSIFIFFENNLSLKNLVQNIDNAFGNPQLKSKSSIEGINTNSKIYWNKNGVSVILTANGRSQYPSVCISSKFDVNKNSPSLFYH